MNVVIKRMRLISSGLHMQRKPDKTAEKLCEKVMYLSNRKFRKLSRLAMSGQNIF